MYRQRDVSQSSSSSRLKSARRSRQDSTDESSNGRECLPIYDNEGNLINVLNTRSGKLEEKSATERLAFDRSTGKLNLVKQVEGINTDNQILVDMAEDGFFALVHSRK